MERINMASLLALTLNRVVLALALGAVLFGVGWLVTIGYVIHTRSGLSIPQEGNPDSLYRADSSTRLPKAQMLRSRLVLR